MNILSVTFCSFATAEKFLGSSQNLKLSATFSKATNGANYLKSWYSIFTCYMHGHIKSDNVPDICRIVHDKCLYGFPIPQHELYVTNL